MGEGRGVRLSLDRNKGKKSRIAYEKKKREKEDLGGTAVRSNRKRKLYARKIRGGGSPADWQKRSDRGGKKKREYGWRGTALRRRITYNKKGNPTRVRRGTGKKICPWPNIKTKKKKKTAWNKDAKGTRK